MFVRWELRSIFLVVDPAGLPDNNSSSQLQTQEMIRHPWWLRKQSVCVIICPCRLLCILSDSSLLKQANSVEDCQACCGEIIILVVIYNKLSSASSTFFSRKKSRTMHFLRSTEMVYEATCRQYLVALFICIWRSTSDEHSSSMFWKLFQHRQKRHKITSQYKIQPAVEIMWIDRTGWPYFIFKKSFDLPASLILLMMKQPHHGISMEPRKSSALRDGVQVSGNSSVPFLCKCPTHKCQSPIAPTKKSEWGPAKQGRTVLRMELLQSRTNSLHTQAMFYVHPLLPSPNCNWENIPVGWLLPHSHSSS